MPGRKSKTIYVKIALTAILLSALLLPIDIKGLTASLYSCGYTHFSCQFLHANIFHLTVNLYAIWIMRFSFSELIIAYLLSVPATFASFDGSIGFSSVIYAMIGIRIFSIRMDRSEWILFAVANIATAFIPHISFGVHLSSFLLGISFARLKKLVDEYRRACNRK